MDGKKHTFSVLVENKFGVLSRVVGLFSGRGYNIASLTVNATQDPAISQMTIVTSGDEAVLEQIRKQLSKLVNVITVNDLSNGDFVASELVLLKLSVTDAKARAGLLQLVEVFHGTVLAVTREDMSIQISGATCEIDNFIELVTDYGILEMARSGQVAIARS